MPLRTLESAEANQRPNRTMETSFRAHSPWGQGPDRLRLHNMQLCTVENVTRPSAQCQIISQALCPLCISTTSHPIIGPDET